MSSTPEPGARISPRPWGPGRSGAHTDAVSAPPARPFKRGNGGLAPPSSIAGPPPKLPPISTNVAGVKAPRLNHGAARSALTVDLDDAPNGNHGEQSDPGPAMPSFLKLDREEMDAKFEDINWDERIRLTKGHQNHPNFDWKWSTFKQMDAQERGLMDRYVNIKPWNHNRVKLMVPDDQLGYVNASHIQLASPSDASRPPLRYIAMQGPTEPSVPYVWRMIAEQTESSSVIVQLTSNAESGATKCNEYFPPDEGQREWILNEHDAWGDGWKAVLKFESMEQLSNDAIEKRCFSLHVEGEDQPRTIWHFWYRRWPDFGVPSANDCDSFFELMRLSREHSSPTGPRIIHCSAGVGRTGTFIALEHLIRELDAGALYDSSACEEAPTPGSKPDLIYETVQQLRQQRKGMVQSEQQYRFLYQVLRKLWTDSFGTRDEDDEDKAEGGVVLAGSTRPSKPNSPATVGDISTDVESYDEDEEDGGVKVRPDSSDASGERFKSAGRKSPASKRAFMKKRAKRLLFD